MGWNAMGSKGGFFMGVVLFCYGVVGGIGIGIG